MLVNIVRVGTIFNIFNYDAVLDWDSKPSITLQQGDALCVTPQLRVYMANEDIQNKTNLYFDKEAT